MILAAKKTVMRQMALMIMGRDPDRPVFSYRR